MGGKGTRPMVLLGILCAFVCAILAVLYLGSHPASPEGAPEASVSAGADLPAPEEGALTVLCPDLGKADGFLLLGASGAVLIDTGEESSARTLLTLMKQYGVDRLDALVLSHFDKDHIGGAAEILEQVEVGTVYRSSFSENSTPYFDMMNALDRTSTKMVTVTETTSFSAAGGDFTLYPPLESSYEKDQDNNSSLLLSVSFDGVSLLFTGDALKDRVQEYLSRQYDGTQYDFLKVPHHGREAKPTALLLEAFQPDYGLITSSYSEPESDKLTDRLTEAGSEVLLTRNGTVIFSCKDGAIFIQQGKS